MDADQLLQVEHVEPRHAVAADVALGRRAPADRRRCRTRVAFAGEDDDAHARVLARVGERVEELLHRLRAEGVAHLRPVDRDARDALAPSGRGCPCTSSPSPTGPTFVVSLQQESRRRRRGTPPALRCERRDPPRNHAEPGVAERSRHGRARCRRTWRRARPRSAARVRRPPPAGRPATPARRCPSRAGSPPGRSRSQARRRRRIWRLASAGSACCVANSGSASQRSTKASIGCDSRKRASSSSAARRASRSWSVASPGEALSRTSRSMSSGISSAAWSARRPPIE